MINSTIPTLQEMYFPHEQQRCEHLPQCVLKWRQRQLLVLQEVKQPQMPSLNNEQWLLECLKHSQVRLIRLDPDLGDARLRLWADACEQANKPVFLRIPAAHGLPRRQNSLLWWLKRLTDWSIAVLLLLALSPLMLGLVLLIRIYLPGPILLRQWHVGKRGKLLRLFKFRTMAVNAKAFEHSENCDDLHITLLGRWMHKYSLEKLPQLFNVLRGEMSLVGPRPWTLHDAVQVSSEERQQLNVLPGMIKARQWRPFQNS